MLLYEPFRNFAVNKRGCFSFDTPKNRVIMIYQIAGVLLSAMLILLGLMTKSSTWLLAGVVLLICTMGLILGVRLRKKSRK